MKKQYELDDHLGNVLATVSDMKIFLSEKFFFKPSDTLRETIVPIA